LLDDGYIGEIRSATVYSSHPLGARGVVPAEAAYALDWASGATLLTVTGGHTIDALERLLGPLVAVSARVQGSGGTYRIDGTDEYLRATAPTDVMVLGEVAGGAVVSLHIQNGRVSESRTRIEIAGTDGALALVAEGQRAGVQMGDLKLRGLRSHWEDFAVPHAAPVFGNVSELYARLAADIAAGTRSVPDFAHALRLHRLLDAIQDSSDRGRRVQLPE
jgi:predicted dehydrogenase